MARKLEQREELNQSILEKILKIIKSNAMEGKLYVKNSPYLNDSTYINILTTDNVPIATIYYTGIEVIDTDPTKRKHSFYIILEENAGVLLSSIEDRTRLNIQYENTSKENDKETRKFKMPFSNKGIENITTTYRGKVGKYRI